MPKTETSSPTLLERLVPVLLLASVVLAFVVGMLWQKVSLLQGGGAAANKIAAQPAGGDTAPENPSGKLTEDQAKKVPPVTSEDHIRGNKDAKVVLIEYSDLQCPFCKQFHPTAQQIKDDYGNDVAWVWRHFPLDQIHPQARPAAEASECVADLGGEDAFWKFVDEAFAGQSTGALNDLSGLAAKVGVNKAAFDKCVSDGKFKDLVEEQYQKGLEAGITGTPGNLIINKNGEAWLIPGALPLASMKQTVDEALQ